MSEKLYGMVMKHPKGPKHLVLGRSERALCGARRDGSQWAAVMRGLVTRATLDRVENVCHNCVKAVGAR